MRRVVLWNLDGAAAFVLEASGVDRSRLKDSHEAWDYVDLDGAASGLLSGFGRSKPRL
jgi:hypothetical protein